MTPNPEMTDPASRPQTRGTFRRLVLLVRSNWISTFGAGLLILAVLGGMTSLYLQLTGTWSSPYIGIVNVIGVPALIIGGLALIPFGLLIYRKELRKRIDEVADRPMYLARAVAVLTIVNFAGVALVGYTGVEFMSSNAFCGVVCHSAMEPEYVSFQSSPHANIDCVDCHIGPGATAAINAKLNGAHQLVGMITGDWSRPIPTPVHQLRPATETCENCHWPEKYLGTKLVVRTRFRPNEQNSAYTNVILMRTGGTGPDGVPTGIHWHTNPQNRVEYVATDDQRMTIPWVRVTRPDGSIDLFTIPGTGDEPPPAGELRVMDCNDCHNRAAHPFERATDAIDEAMAAGLISRRIPFIRKNGLEILGKEWSRENVERAIKSELVSLYGANGELDPEMEPLIDGAAQKLVAIWRRNVYPARALTWDTYPTLKSHAGCFRCHNGEHSTPSGLVITNECDKCHVVLSNEERDPAILNSLGLRRGR